MKIKSIDNIVDLDCTLTSLWLVITNLLIFHFTRSFAPIHFILRNGIKNQINLP